MCSTCHKRNPARLDEWLMGRNSEIKRERKSLDFLTGDKGQTAKGAESQSGFIWRVCHVTISDTCEARRSSGLFCWWRDVLIKLTTLQHARGERPCLLCLWGGGNNNTAAPFLLKWLWLVCSRSKQLKRVLGYGRSRADLKPRQFGFPTRSQIPTNQDQVSSLRLCCLLIYLRCKMQKPTEWKQISVCLGRLKFKLD